MSTNIRDDFHNFREGVTVNWRTVLRSLLLYRALLSLFVCRENVTDEYDTYYDTYGVKCSS